MGARFYADFLPFGRPLLAILLANSDQTAASVLPYFGVF
jgi:hypothetical protein